MLTKATIEDIVEMRMPEQRIVQHLEELTSESLDVQTIQTFIEVLRATLDAPSRQLSQYIGTIDPSGTGGSGKPHFNTSTTVAFVLAAGGLKVAKFGNRAAQSQCGSFDLLEALRIPSHVAPQLVPELLDSVGLAFLFAPQYYPGLAKLAPIRKSFGKRTIFNNIGPLLNPIQPFYRVMGVSCGQAQNVIAQYLSTEKSNRRALVVHSQSGLDELEPYVANTVVDAMPGYIAAAELADVPALRNGSGIWSPHSKEQQSNSSERADKMRTGMSAFQFTPEENHRLFFEVINGDGPAWLMDLVCLNAAAGFVANCCSSIDACFDMAKDLIKSGAVAAKVEECKQAYAKLSTR